MGNGANQRTVGDLTARHYKALAALMAAPSIQAAADASGLGLRTLTTYLADPVFAAAYKEAQRSATQQATARLAAMAEQAVLVLASIMLSKTAPPATRANAAKTVLELNYRAREQQDIIDRIELLEAGSHERK